MKKRVLACMLSLCILVGLLPMAALAADETSADNWEKCAQCSEEHPHMISTTLDLDRIRTHSVTEGDVTRITGYFKLANDIVFTSEDFSEGGQFCNSGLGWLPIGKQSVDYDDGMNETGVSFFSGQLDGDNHTISGLKIDGQIYINSLFAAIHPDGKIINLNIGEFMFNPSYADGRDGENAGRWLGGIAAYNKGLIENCTVSDSYFYSTGGISGAISGDCGGIQRNCTVKNVVMKSYSQTGQSAGGNGDKTGLISGITDRGALIDNCDVYDSEIYGQSRGSGGIVGLFYGTTIRNCSVSGTKISNDQECAGGIAGGNFTESDSITIENCQVINCTIDGPSDAGGVIGSFLGTKGKDYTIRDCSVSDTTISIHKTPSSGRASIGAIAVGSRTVKNLTIESCITTNVTLNLPEELLSDTSLVVSQIVPQFPLTYEKMVIRDITSDVLFDFGPGFQGKIQELPISVDVDPVTYRLPTPDRSGYDFAGWSYLEANKENDLAENDPINPQTAYWAKWVSKITLNANGGFLAEDSPATVEVTENAQIGALPTPTRTDYTFSGWFTAAEGGTKVEPDTVPTGNATYYAQWTKDVGEESGYTVNAILDQIYTGVDIEPAVVVKKGETVLTDGYTVDYRDNTDVGTAMATVKVDEYSEEVDFKIVKDEHPTIEMPDLSVTYGTPYTMTATAKTAAGNEITGEDIITIMYYTDQGCTTQWTPSGDETQPADAGIYYAKATLTEADNYVSANTTAKITISNATFDVVAEGYTGSYDGQGHSITVTADGAAVTYCDTENGDYTSTNPTYTNAGEYTVYYKASKANHDDVTGSAAVKINKAKPTVSISASPEALTGGGAVTLTVDKTGLPTDAEVTVTCNVEVINVTENEDGAYSAGLPNSTSSYTFTVTYAGDDNHEAASGVCIVSVTQYTSPGGSGFGDTTTETTTNSDGSTTTTVTDKTTGTVTETTKHPDGSTTAVETKKDGTVTTTETAKNGVKTVTVDEPGKDVVATVTVPSGMECATGTIHADVTPGTVAVDAKSGELIKLSVPTATGMLVKLNGSAELVLEDRSKTFIDTPDHWGENAIDFAVAHGMFYGVSETIFAPNRLMTRGMLMTVLARFDGQSTGGGKLWYAKGMEWAKAVGVSDGTNPENAVTREQLIAMLYRYAGSPSAYGDLEAFSDAGSVSAYAVKAMRWAVGTGIISGMEDGTLAPRDGATRAQVAAVLMRFIENMVK